MSLLLIVVLLPLAVIAAGQLGLLKGTAPNNLGLRDGRLKPPSKTPNSVTSQAGLWADHPMAARAGIAPLRYTGDGPAAMKKLAEVLRGLERTVIVTEKPDYLYAQCTTALLKFTDDVEFALDATAGVIHVRSASRIGHGDRGVNRARVEDIRKKAGFQ